MSHRWSACTSAFVFHGEKKVFLIWNDMRNFLLCVLTIHLKNRLHQLHHGRWSEEVKNQLHLTP